MRRKKGFQTLLNEVRYNDRTKAESLETRGAYINKATNQVTVRLTREDFGRVEGLRMEGLDHEEIMLAMMKQKGVTFTNR